MYYQSDKFGRFESLASCALDGGVNLQISYTAEGQVAMAKNTEQILEGKVRRMFLRGSLEFSPEDLKNIIQTLQRASEKLEAMGHA